MSSIDSVLLTYLLTGLAVGFGHCIGMCGPLVISFSISRPRAAYMPYLLYHCGRLTTYAILGGIMAATGSFTYVVAHIALLQKSAMFFTGGLIVLMGLAMGGWIARISWFSPDGQTAAGPVRLYRRLSKSSSTLAYFPIGVLLGLLPCGPVYTALLGVVRSGMEAPGMFPAAATGMLQMMLFGVGTVPALVLVAGLADMGWLKLRDKIYKIGALLLVGLGIFYMISAVRY